HIIPAARATTGTAATARAREPRSASTAAPAAPSVGSSHGAEPRAIPSRGRAGGGGETGEENESSVIWSFIAGRAGSPDRSPLWGLIPGGLGAHGGGRRPESVRRRGDPLGTAG